jgi:hypothetical protein
MPTFDRHALSAAVVLGTSLLLPSVATTQNYLPLSVGNRWTYFGPRLGNEVHTVSGTTELRGRLVFVMSYSGNPANEGLENYWISRGDGFFLCGFFRNAEKIGVAYDPPIRMLRVPASVGDVSTTTTTSYSWPDWQTPFQTFTISFTVIEDVLLDLPVGSIKALGLGQTLAAQGMHAYAAYAPDGSARTSTPDVSLATDWFAAGLGEVQYNTDDFYQLVDFEIPTPVVGATWGRLKRLYR